jgi:hypothetical protein
MRPTKMTADAMKLLQTEAQRRAEAKTNKELAQLTGLAPMYVANVVAKIRRSICQRVEVSRETGGNVNS